LGLWFGIQILEAHLLPAKDAGGVAYFAHIGGFVAGLLLLPLFRPRRKKRAGR
jgi:membrane associated rhomboid family serine protease